MRSGRSFEPYRDVYRIPSRRSRLHVTHCCQEGSSSDPLFTKKFIPLARSLSSRKSGMQGGATRHPEQVSKMPSRLLFICRSKVIRGRGKGTNYPEGTAVCGYGIHWRNLRRIVTRPFSPRRSILSHRLSPRFSSCSETSAPRSQNACSAFGGRESHPGRGHNFGSSRPYVEGLLG